MGQLCISQGATKKMKNSTLKTHLPINEIIDKRLKEFVCLHHIDLLRKINYQVNKLKDNIYEKQLSYYYLTTEQFEIINRLTTICKKQLTLFENLTMFEQRILCHKLPKSFDYIKVDTNQEQCVNKRNQQDFNVLQLQILNPTSYDHKYQVDILMHSVYHYHSLSKKKIIDVYPQIIVDVPKISLNRILLDYRSLNDKLKILFNNYTLIIQFFI
ncbi:unnamed protein product [Didymodactylos carnosus]|uniref:Uncharacterized protein n=1 Tax=Didymodactylos carnosus TaxID=1234261 RepID=A0A8S2FGP1_9BILA|nr:unnamed protein product [Didymodactylos carnosus]CAF4255260.1 unnamed protein product [Didymodactylos carnosus]